MTNTTLPGTQRKDIRRDFPADPQLPADMHPVTGYGGEVEDTALRMILAGVRHLHENPYPRPRFAAPGRGPTNAAGLALELVLWEAAGERFAGLDRPSVEDGRTSWAGSYLFGMALTHVRAIEALGWEWWVEDMSRGAS